MFLLGEKDRGIDVCRERAVRSNLTLDRARGKHEHRGCLVEGIEESFRGHTWGIPVKSSSTAGQPSELVRSAITIQSTIHVPSWSILPFILRIACSSDSLSIFACLRACACGHIRRRILLKPPATLLPQPPPHFRAPTQRPCGRRWYRSPPHLARPSRQAHLFVRGNITIVGRSVRCKV